MGCGRSFAVCDVQVDMCTLNGERKGANEEFLILENGIGRPLALWVFAGFLH
ncbi:hypothetical protein K491DRAFT_688519, partial [Lophiostoma macrostomum CBS 122681]